MPLITNNILGNKTNNVLKKGLLSHTQTIDKPCSLYNVKTLPDNEILELSKFKAFADDKPNEP